MSLIQVSNLTFCYEGSCDNIFENVSFQIDTDWRLGLTGRNGRGKTTLLRLLQGMYPHRGTIRASVGFDYFPYTVPDPEECPLELLPAICPEVPQWCFLRELAPLEVPEEALYRPFSTLSGGERTMTTRRATPFKVSCPLMCARPRGRRARSCRPTCRTRQPPSAAPPLPVFSCPFPPVWSASARVARRRRRRL